MRAWAMLVLVLLLGGSVPASANPVLGAEVAEREQAYARGVMIPLFTLHRQSIKQDRSPPLPGAFKNPAGRQCPPFCVQPQHVPGAISVKLEDFPRLSPAIEDGQLLLVDMRTSEWFKNGTIPGSVNLPYNDLVGKRTKAIARTRMLKNLDILVFCNGWWCGQSPTGIEALASLGYTGKIYYFRGGVQDWLDAGLPLVAAEGLVKSKPCP